MATQKKVLIVDDDPINVKVLKFLLQREFELEIAMDGSQCLELLPSFSPDLILLDVMMPEIDGYEVCRRIRLDSGFRFVKILFLSGKVTDEDRIMGYEAGGDDYITKPFLKNELLAKIKIFLRLKNTEEFSEMKADLIKIISHETRTPLSVIQGYCQLLKMSMNSFNTEDVAGWITNISGACRRITDLVDKSLALTELRSRNKLNLSEKGFNRTFLDGLQESTKQRLLSKKQELLIKSEPLTSMFNADWELLHTALTYTIDEVGLMADKGEKLGMEFWSDDTYVYLLLTYNGRVPPKEEERYLFEDFETVDVLHHHSGTGLSLCYARTVAQLHQGDLKFRRVYLNEENEGNDENESSKGNESNESNEADDSDCSAINDQFSSRMGSFLFTFSVTL